jgi:hypothetical protein
LRISISRTCWRSIMPIERVSTLSVKPSKSI